MAVNIYLYFIMQPTLKVWGCPYQKLPVHFLFKSTSFHTFPPYIAFMSSLCCFLCLLFFLPVRTRKLFVLCLLNMLPNILQREEKSPYSVLFTELLLYSTSYQLLSHDAMGDSLGGFPKTAFLAKSLPPLVKLLEILENHPLPCYHFFLLYLLPVLTTCLK